MKRRSGFMLLEILIAVTILSVGVVIAMTCIMRCLRTSKRLENLTTAALLAQSKLNDVEAALDIERQSEGGLIADQDEGDFADFLGDAPEAQDWSWEYSYEQIYPPSRTFDAEVDDQIDLTELWRLTLIVYRHNQQQKNEMIRLVTLHTPRAEEVYVEELE